MMRISTQLEVSKNSVLSGGGIRRCRTNTPDAGSDCFTPHTPSAASGESVESPEPLPQGGGVGQSLCSPEVLVPTSIHSLESEPPPGYGTAEALLPGPADRQGVLSHDVAAAAAALGASLHHSGSPCPHSLIRTVTHKILNLVSASLKSTGAKSSLDPWGPSGVLAGALRVQKGSGGQGNSARKVSPEQGFPAWELHGSVNPVRPEDLSSAVLPDATKSV
ncbi:hypothetical protein CB1_001683037 [Camelus ferus]|nr:hypothetical protein CB1_001683037 [Camelus ferus]